MEVQTSEARRPSNIRGAISLIALFLMYFVLPIFIFAVLGHIGRDLMSDADKAYIDNYMWDLHSRTARNNAGFMFTAIYIYATPVFLLPWILYEISKRFFQPALPLLKVTEVICAFPFFILSYPLLLIHASITRPDEDPRLVISGGASLWDSVDRMVGIANVVGIFILVALQTQMLRELISTLICCPTALLIVVAVFNVFRLAARQGKKIV